MDPRFCGSEMPGIRQLSVGGEPCPHRTAQQLLTCFPNTQILNGYGATETTIGTIACEITWEMATSAKPLPIGYASHNSNIYIVDEAGNRLPDGQAGELVIVSDMITPGYFKDDERTAKFYFTQDDGTRGYHTRDIAWVEDGLVYYAGRADNMVKVGGYRVELEEVERHLSKAGPVERCAVAPAEEDQRVVMLVAYVVLKPGIQKGIRTTIAIKNEIAQWMQGYMIPQKFVYLDSLPYNTNGKIDRKTLRDMSKISK